MLRLDPGEERIKSTRQFRVWEGGGEYNVARGLRRCFNKRAAIVTAFAKNEIGRLMEDLILQEFLLVDSLAYLPLHRYMQCWGIALLVHIGLEFEATD